MRRTKIVCTLGPASDSESMIEKLLEAGMNVARFNMSHDDHAIHEEKIRRFRAVRDRMGVPAAVLLDTKGPEIRLGDFENGSAILNDGDDFAITSKEILGTKDIAPVLYKDLPRQLKENDVVLVDDGKIELRVKFVQGDTVHCVVVHGGKVSNHKGINIPNVHIDMEYLSEKDKADLIFAVEMDVDFVAASFVRSKDDVIALRRFLDYHGGHSIQIISKIENLEGVNNFDEILAHSNGIMVARGDMGVEIDFERLPGLQKKFIKKCYQSGKMVITATQMMESMISSPTPTRAEITDVANAVFDGTSAVMLSGESAMGKYPLQALKTMAKIAEQAERDAFEMGVYNDRNYDMDASDTTNAICDATCTTAHDLKAKAILAVTIDGYTARRMSKFRPQEPIVAATPKLKTFHQLALSWGVLPAFSIYQHTTDDLFMHAIDCAKEKNIVKPGDIVVITAGIPLGMQGTTNVLKVETVPKDSNM